MGFSFAGIRKELDSPELGKLFIRLQADCHYLAPFPDWHAVITFLHDRKRGYRLKDRILWRLIRCHQQGDQGKKLGVVFLAFFAPAILSIYVHGRMPSGRRGGAQPGPDGRWHPRGRAEENDAAGGA